MNVKNVDKKKRNIHIKIFFICITYNIMRIISFDIGIKNMAYCIFDVYGGSQFNILDWNIMNLMNVSETIEEEIPKCNCILEPKKQKKKQQVENIPCKKMAKYKKEEKYFCEKHAKNSVFMIPTKECSLTYLKKLPIQELKNICHTNNFFETNQIIPTFKNQLLEFVNNSLQKKCLESIVQKKKKSANEIDLISIGRNMTEILNRTPYMDTMTHVIIENQISPIANRMKTIQGMLTQYFIMKGSPTIEFISSSNKLKGFSVEPKEKTEKTEKTDKQNYKKHKTDGIQICSLFLDNNENLKKWKHCLLNIKKDDYADSFLQGIWYLKNKNMIQYNDYKISLLNP